MHGFHFVSHACMHALPDIRARRTVAVILTPTLSPGSATPESVSCLADDGERDRSCQLHYDKNLEPAQLLTQSPSLYGSSGNKLWSARQTLHRIPYHGMRHATLAFHDRGLQKLLQSGRTKATMLAYISVMHRSLV